MNKEATFLKMKTPADMLTVNFFASTGQLKGRFVQEIDPPWSIWWQPITEQSLIGRIGTMIKGELPPPETVWEPGRPNGECREISWLDLFRKAIIKRSENRHVAEEVILITPEKDIFYAVVRQHFMLQQGQVEFAVFDSGGREYFMLRIQNPSLWVFNTVLGNNWVWYNLMPGQSGIYVEAGHFIHDISGDSCFNKFQITESGILLIQKDGRLLTLKPRWKKGESLIKVQFSGPMIQQKDDQEILTVKPILRPSDSQDLPTLWKIEDQQRFKAILVNESLGRFRNFVAVVCKSGNIWVYARGKSADRGLASVLTDAFSSFAEICHLVFVPKNQTLAPRLSSQRLHEIIAENNTDVIVIEPGIGGLQPHLIAENSWSPVEEFITLQAELAAQRAEALKSTWKFEFKELKKKKQVVEIELKTASFEKLEAVKEGGEVGAAGAGMRARTQKTRINLADVPEPGASEVSALRLELDNIDRQLLQNVANAALWRQRGEICRRMRLRVSAVASLMNSALLSKDNQTLAECIFEFSKLRPEFKPLTQESVSEVEKGRLLADIRKESVNSEFYYMLMLAFAAKFNDADIFMQAVAAMKTAFPGENRQFYSFNEVRSASGGGMNVENRVELLTENNMPQISLNVKKFLQQVGCCPDVGCIGMARFQLHKILSFHLSRKAADSLVSLNSYSAMPGSYSGGKLPVNEGFLEFFYRRIDNWPESIEYPNASPAVSRWVKLLVMDKIRETPLRDFFTGDLYKPPYLFQRAEEGGSLHRVGWIKALSADQFPDVCDGRPIARAIYYRFADNNSDWNEYFKYALKRGEPNDISKAQRLLLLMVSEFGPHPAFKQYIMPMVVNNRPLNEKWDIYDLTMYCDMYRLCLAYRQPIDEQRLFNMLISRSPLPPNGWDDFKNSAEWIILCLLLTSSPQRRFQLDNLLVRAYRWMREALQKGNKDMFAESLTIYSFLCIGILADLVPEKLEFHQLLEKRKVIWMEHAFAASAKGRAAFTEWQNACGY